MYYFYNTNPERRNAWKSAYEIKIAALEHEKRRFHMYQEFSLAKPQVINQRRSGWAAVFKAPLLLLSILIK